jgi:hypothetical protein
MTEQEIKDEFNCKGFFLGVVPVYAYKEADDADEIYLAERNGIPEWTIPVIATLWEGIVWVINLGGIFHGVPRRYPVFITEVFDVNQG